MAVGGMVAVPVFMSQGTGYSEVQGVALRPGDVAVIEASRQSQSSVKARCANSQSSLKSTTPESKVEASRFTSSLNSLGFYNNSFVR